MAEISVLWRRADPDTGDGSRGTRALAWRWSRWGARARDDAWRWSRGDDGRAMVVAATLGLPAALSPETRSHLRAAGLAHLLAVSGLHVGFAFAVAWRVALGGLGGRGRAGLLTASGLAAAALAAFCSLAGWSPSVVRAGGSRLVRVHGALVGRVEHPLHRLAWVGSLMVLVRPWWLASPSFQLSMVAAAAMGHGPRTEAWWRAGVRVACATMPICALHFGDAAPIGVFTNLVAVPAFQLIIAPLMVVGWALVPALGLVSLEPAAAASHGMLALARYAGEAPPLPMLAVVLLLVVVWGLGCRWRRWRHLVPTWTLVGWWWVAQQPMESPPRAALVAGQRQRSVLWYDAPELCIWRLDVRPAALGRIVDEVAWPRATRLHPPAGRHVASAVGSSRSGRSVSPGASRSSLPPHVSVWLEQRARGSLRSLRTADGAVKGDPHDRRPCGLDRAWRRAVVEAVTRRCNAGSSSPRLPVAARWEHDGRVRCGVDGAWQPRGHLDAATVRDSR